MPPPIKVVATITPAPGKLDRLVEVLAKLAAAVERKEHGCLEYHLHRRVRDVGPQQGEQGWAGEELVMIETYKDKAAYEEHSHSEDFRGLVKVMGEEGLLAKGLEITFLEPIAGFKGRL